MRAAPRVVGCSSGAGGAPVPPRLLRRCGACAALLRCAALLGVFTANVGRADCADSFNQSERMCFQHSKWVQFFHEFSTAILINELCALGQFFCLVCWSLRCTCIDFEFGSALLEFGRFAGSTMGSDMLLFFNDLLKIRSVRILDTIVCSGDIALALLSGLGRPES